MRDGHPETRPPAAAAPVPVVVYLSGGRRGTTLRLAGERLAIGTAAGAEIQIPAGRSGSTASRSSG